jgi:hypothetical protein
MSLVVTVIFSFVVIALVIAAMGIGVMAGREPIKGSCGGLNGGSCELCSGRCQKSDGEQ